MDSIVIVIVCGGVRYGDWRGGECGVWRSVVMFACFCFVACDAVFCLASFIGFNFLDKFAFCVLFTDVT